MEISDDELIQDLTYMLNHFFLLDVEFEQIRRYLNSQDYARDRLNKPDLIEPNIKRLQSIKEKRKTEFNKMAIEAVEKGYSEGKTMFVSGRNDGKETYFLKISLEKSEE